MKYFLIISLIFLFACKERHIFDAKEFDIIGDSITLNTKNIQQAIDKLHSVGGGTLHFSKGIYFTGTIELKSNVNIDLAADAKLLGSPYIEHYKEYAWGHNKDRQPYHLIVAYGQRNIEIKGLGVIDGNAELFWEDYERDSLGNMIIPRWIKAKEKKISPLIELVDCENINISGVTIHTGGGWNLHLHDSRRINIDNIKIINNLYSPNSDGIDITGSEDITISNCYIKTCDDAICLKTTPDSKECRRVTVTNCIIETLCVGLKLGCNESFKDISDVTFSNCIVNKSSRAVGIYVREEGNFSNIAINNIISNTNAPLIFNRPIQIMVERRDSSKAFGSVKNVSISNFVSETEGRILLTCEKGCILENVVLRDIMLTYPMIEDPSLYIAGSGSSQFPKINKHPEAGSAKAAIVAENIKNFAIDGLIITWPKNDSIPNEWKHPERIENGTFRIHKPNYSIAKQTEFNILWARDITNGYIHSPLASASSKKLNSFDISNCINFITK